MLNIIGRSIKGVAFDLEGTVINLESLHHTAHLLTARIIGVKLPDLTSIDEITNLIPHFIGGPRELIAQEIFTLSNKEASVESIVKLQSQTYHRFLAERNDFEPRKGFLKFLESITELGLKTSIGSLTPKDEAGIILGKSGLNILFNSDSIVLREDVKNLKPSPDVYLETARRMGIMPYQQLVFEDSPRGIQAANTANSLAFAMPVYDNEYVRRELDMAGALRIFNDWREIDLNRYTSIENRRPLPKS